MTKNKTVVVTVATSFALVLLTAWGFYHTLQPGSGKIKLTDYPPKAVMAQAQAINEARLDQLAQSGRIEAGMKAEHVRQAFGEPSRIQRVEQDGQQYTVWWYEHEGWMGVVFDNGNVVSKIAKQP